MKSSKPLQTHATFKRAALGLIMLAVLSLACSINPFGQNNTADATAELTATGAGQLPAPVPRNNGSGASPTLLPPVPREATATAAAAAVASGPTATPTKVFVTATATPTRGPSPTPTITPTSLPTPVPSDPEWTVDESSTSYVGADFTIVGKVVNKKAAPQKDVTISGQFFNESGEVISALENVTNFLPIDVVPVDIGIPFQISVESSEKIARYDLQITSASAADNPPRDDFEVTEDESWVNDDGEFCVNGRVENQGAPIENSLFVFIELYNAKGELFSFAQYPVSRPDTIQEGATASFELCADQSTGTMANYDLVAFGW